MERVYETTTLADWVGDPDALMCPRDPALRDKWGWKEDEHGKWYRQLADGQQMNTPPQSPEGKNLSDSTLGLPGGMTLNCSEAADRVESNADLPGKSASPAEAVAALETRKRSLREQYRNHFNNQSPRDSEQIALWAATASKLWNELRFTSDLLERYAARLSRHPRPGMSADVDILQDYCRRFDNYVELSHQAVAFDPRFDTLMRQAIERGSPLTRKEINQVFGQLNWGCPLRLGESDAESWENGGVL